MAGRLWFGGYRQFIVSDPQQDFIPDIDPKRLTEGSRDDDTPILAHTDPPSSAIGTLRF
jgi:hypothetical protein